LQIEHASGICSILSIITDIGNSGKGYLMVGNQREDSTSVKPFKIPVPFITGIAPA
jgi:hypothetical protein